MSRKKKFKIENHVSEYDIRDLDLKNIPLNDDYGDNLEFNHEDTKEKLISYIERDKKDGYREIYMDVTSLRGSIGAVHYYVTLCDRSICFTNLEDKEKRYKLGGYSTKGVPDKYENFKIELQRPVDERDIKNDERWGREDYMRVELGELTRGFWTEEDAIQIGIDAFKAIFKGKWKLRINPYSSTKRERIIYRDKVK